MDYADIILVETVAERRNGEWRKRLVLLENGTYGVEVEWFSYFNCAYWPRPDFYSCYGLNRQKAQELYDKIRTLKDVKKLL